jgi:hypothetical protein
MSLRPDQLAASRLQPSLKSNERRSLALVGHALRRRLSVDLALDREQGIDALNGSVAIGDPLARGR